MPTNRFTTVYKLTNMDKARFRRAATRYAPIVSVTAAYWLLMLEAYAVRDGDMVLLRPPGFRPSIEQFARLVGHHFHSAERAPPKAQPRRKSRSDRPGGFTAEDLLSDMPTVMRSEEERAIPLWTDHEQQPAGARDSVPIRPGTESV